MKLLVKLTLVVGTLTAIGTSAALADDQQLTSRLAREQSQNSSRTEQTTVAVYANHQGAGRVDANYAQPESRFELRSNPHGQVYGAWVQAN